MAVATTWSVALRSPEMTSGTASGHSTRLTTWPPVMPRARAAYTASGSAPETPVAVAVRMAGSASTARTRTVGAKPVPSSSTTSTSRPIDGIARAALLSPMTRKPPRPVWPMRTPSGTATIAPMTHGDDGVLEVLEQQLAGAALAAPVAGVEEVGEVAHAVRRLLAQGRVPRWTSRMIASATSASSSVRTSPTMIGV